MTGSLGSCLTVETMKRWLKSLEAPVSSPPALNLGAPTSVSGDDRAVGPAQVEVGAGGRAGAGQGLVAPEHRLGEVAGEADGRAGWRRSRCPSPAGWRPRGSWSLQPEPPRWARKVLLVEVPPSASSGASAATKAIAVPSARTPSTRARASPPAGAEPARPGVVNSKARQSGRAAEGPTRETVVGAGRAVSGRRRVVKVRSAPTVFHRVWVLVAITR